MIARDTFHRTLSFDDLATGAPSSSSTGTRNILEIVEYYMSFFVHESCGYCTPCRVGNVFLQKAIAKFRKARQPLGYRLPARPVTDTIIETSRCGLGMTSPNPILSTLENFPLVYSAVVKPSATACAPPSTSSRRSDDARKLAKRRSHIFDKDFSA
jgi:[NiFe] hydrogenase diaphorase moiety large subunit